MGCISWAPSSPVAKPRAFDAVPSGHRFLTTDGTSFGALNFQRHMISRPKFRLFPGGLSRASSNLSETAAARAAIHLRGCEYKDEDLEAEHRGRQPVVLSEHEAR